MTPIVTPRADGPASGRTRQGDASDSSHRWSSPTDPNHPMHGGDDVLGRAGGVEVVMWPAEAARREALSQGQRPCVLIVAVDAPAPVNGPNEDWIREPVDAEELAVRAAALRRRVECGKAPTLDDGLLAHDGTWVAIPPAQIAMVELLVSRAGAVVHKDELAAAAGAAGASDHAEAVKAAMSRLCKRLAPLGLVLRSIRGRGYLLEVTCSCPVHGSTSAAEAKDCCPGADRTSSSSVSSGETPT